MPLNEYVTTAAGRLRHVRMFASTAAPIMHVYGYVSGYAIVYDMHIDGYVNGYAVHV